MLAAAAAEPRPPSAPTSAVSEQLPALTLADAIQRVLRDNPALRAAGFSLRAQETRRDQANLKPAWHGTIEAENFLGTDRVSGTSGLEATLRLGTVIERGGKRERRVAQADADQALLMADQDVSRLDLLAEVARRFIDVAANQETLAVTRQATTLANRSSELVEQRVRAAKASDAEAGKARILVARAEIAAEHAEHELRSSRVALAATWNAREPEFSRAESTFFDLPEPESLEALVAALVRNPDLARYASARRVEEARLALARAGRTPDMTFNAGVRRLQAGSDQSFVFSLSVPFFSAARAAPYVREAELRRDAVEADAEAARADLYRTMYALYQELLHARTQVSALREKVIPEAERTLKHTEAGFGAGRYSYLELVDAQQQLLTVRSEAVSAASNYHLLFVELERLAGRSLGVTAKETTP